MLFSLIVIILLAGGLVALLLKAFAQNQGLWRHARAAGRPLPRLLWNAFVLWSPLALVIVVLALAASAFSAGIRSLAYRTTLLDEFCAVEGAAGAVVPCTGMRGQLQRANLRPAGAASDVASHLAERFRATRSRYLGMTADQLHSASKNRVEFQRSLMAQGVLELETAPEDDHELVRLKRELQLLLATPTQPARDLLDVVRFVTERDARVRRMRELTALVNARRELANDRAYAGLPLSEQGPLWLRHRLSHLLSKAQVTPGEALYAALAALPADADPGSETVLAVKRTLVTALARNEAAAVGVLQRETTTAKGSAGLYLALGMPRGCVVVGAGKAQGAAGPESLPFACASLPRAPVLALASLGARESVRLSIERWHANAERDSARRLGALALLPATTTAELSNLSAGLADAVPDTIHLGRADCGFLRPLGCLGNAVRAAAEEGYAEALADARQQQPGANLDGAAGRSLDRQVGDRLLRMDADLERMRVTAHAYTDRFFILGNVLRVLGWLALALIVVKSYLYVLALQVFHSDHGRAGIGFDDAPAVQGEYVTGRRVTIDRDFPHSLITAKQLSNTDNNVRLAPWPWSAPLGRILRGRYFVFAEGRFLSDAPNPISGQAEPVRGMVASAGGGLAIVEWKLQAGEEVIFAYRDFYGASSNVVLSSEISLRLSTLLLGRILFRIARCPEGEGRLLLRANVEDIDQEQVRAIPPERMIAWNRHARFTVHSGRGLWKTLVNGYTLVRQERLDGPSGLIVVSSDDVGSNLGSIRFVKRIFSAIF